MEEFRNDKTKMKRRKQAAALTIVECRSQWSVGWGHDVG